MRSHPFPHVVGRYALHGEIASGGMATIHVGRLMGPVGFARTVAVKRLHPHFAKDPEFVAMLMDEARLAARIRHPNVVSIVDVVAAGGELLLVMDYVAGESLARLLHNSKKRGLAVDLPIAIRVVSEVLAGLHAAHEVTSDRGLPLDVVHRDVSPQNILVGRDGITHLIDFGVAKAAGRIQTTQDGQLKGKLAYMAPEQVRSGQVDRRTDVYAAGLVLWEAIVGRRPFEGHEAQLLYEVLTSDVPPPSRFVPAVPPALDAAILCAVSKDPSKRFATAAEMAEALEDAIRPATSREVSRWVYAVAADALRRRERLVSEVEGQSIVGQPPHTVPSYPDEDSYSNPGGLPVLPRAEAGSAIPPPVPALFPPPPAHGPGGPSVEPAFGAHAAAADSASWADDLAPTAVRPAPPDEGPDMATDTSTTVSSARLKVDLRRSRLVHLGIASGGLAALIAAATAFVALTAPEQPPEPVHTGHAGAAGESPLLSAEPPADSAGHAAPEAPNPGVSASAPPPEASSALTAEAPTRRAPPPPRPTADKKKERLEKRGW